MADAKKPDKGAPKPAPKKIDPFIEIVTLMVGAFFFLYMINGLLGLFSSTGFFSRGWYGLTPHGIMERHTRPINSLQNAIGVTVISNQDSTSVYDSPGGKKIGTQPFNIRGKILQGPVEIDGERYWYVDFKSGSDGWVKEKDIAYLDSEPSFAEKVVLWVWSAIPYLKFLSIFLSLLIMVWIAYIVLKLTEVRKNQHALIYPNLVKTDEPEVNPKWQKILAESESLNENDWKLAIIESDIMLDDILDKLSLPGDTMGEKMKAVEKSDFTTIDLAWEAHKIRNQIAHEGSDFILTQREVRRVIDLYRQIFEEFQII